LYFEPETGGLDYQSLSNLGPHRLVAGLHIRAIEIRENIIQEGEELVREIVPIIQHASGALYHESRTKANIAAILQDGSDQIRNIRRVIFQIGILYHHDITGDSSESCAEGGCLAGVALMLQQTDARITGTMLSDQVRGFIARRIVDYHDFVEVTYRLVDT